MKLRTLILAGCLFSGGFADGQVVEGVLTDGLVQDDALFGNALALDGEWLAVGSSDWDDLDHQPNVIVNLGSVSLFKRIDEQWVFHKSIQPEFQESLVSGRYASSLSLTDGYLFVGSPFADPFSDLQNVQGDLVRTGRVRVYELNMGGDENWGHVQTIESPDAMRNARFGFSIDSIDDQLVIGESRYDGTGRVHVYQLDHTTSEWSPSSILNPILDCHLNPRSFGSAVAIDHNGESEYSIIVGDPGTAIRTNCPGVVRGGGVTPWTSNVGSVHFFGTVDGTWYDLNVVPNQRVLGPFAGLEVFGASVALDAGYAIAGAPEQGEWIWSDTGGFYSRHGQVILFEFDSVSNEWVVQDQFFPYHQSDPQKNFGSSVAIDGDTVLISSRTGNFVSTYGRHSGGGLNVWGEIANTTVAELDSTNVIGRVVLDGDHSVVGAPRNDIGGSIVLLDLGFSACPTDLNRDSVLDFFDVSIFLDAYLAHDRTGDFNDDGYWNFFDLTDFINAVIEGCP